MDVGSSFAKVLKFKRRAAGLTQEQLAERSNVTARYISLLECNNQQPSLGYIYVLAIALDTTMSELMESVEKELDH